MPLKVQLEEQPTLNLTSMIDVAFLLVIFFMLGTRFVTHESKINLKVPQVKNVQALDPVPLKRAIQVHRDGRIGLDDELLTLEELTQRLREDRRRNPQLGVIVRGDAEGAFQDVAGVLAACRQAGVTDLGISVRLARKDR